MRRSQEEAVTCPPVPTLRIMGSGGRRMLPLASFTFVHLQIPWQHEHRHAMPSCPDSCFKTKQIQHATAQETRNRCHPYAKNLKESEKKKKSVMQKKRRQGGPLGSFAP